MSYKNISQMHLRHVAKSYSDIMTIVNELVVTLRFILLQCALFDMQGSRIIEVMRTFRFCVGFHTTHTTILKAHIVNYHRYSLRAIYRIHFSSTRTSIRLPQSCRHAIFHCTTNPQRYLVTQASTALHVHNATPKLPARQVSTAPQLHNATSKLPPGKLPQRHKSMTLPKAARQAIFHCSTNLLRYPKAALTEASPASQIHNDTRKLPVMQAFTATHIHKRYPSVFRKIPCRAGQLRTRIIVLR